MRGYELTFIRVNLGVVAKFTWSRDQVYLEWWPRVLLGVQGGDGGGRVLARWKLDHLLKLTQEHQDLSPIEETQSLVELKLEMNDKQFMEHIRFDNPYKTGIVVKMEQMNDAFLGVIDEVLHSLVNMIEESELMKSLCLFVEETV
ncbi:hypothetical protein Tco_0864771 [Tanacetum coccineum]